MNYIIRNLSLLHVFTEMCIYDFNGPSSKKPNKQKYDNKLKRYYSLLVSNKKVPFLKKTIISLDTLTRNKNNRSISADF